MGVVQSKRREVKAYASKYTSSLLHTSTTSTQQQQQLQSSHSATTTSTSINNNKNNDNLTQALDYSTESRSNTPLSSVSNNNNSTINNTSSHRSIVSPNKISPSFNSKEDSPSFLSVNQSNSFYLPKDWDLKEYQYNLHFALKTLYGGNITPAVAPRLKKGSRVIQMGTCSGPWIMDMATQYPECLFTAIEVIPDSLQALPSLPNISFIRDRPYDKGIDFPDNSVDYIHLRSMGLTVGMDKWPLLFKEARRILKPDGVIRIEEICNAPTGTVMIESFIETLRQILAENNQDYDIAPKYGSILQENGFHTIESKKKSVHFGSDGKLSEDLVITILNGFEDLGVVLAPRLGLQVEDYRHRIEMICAQCVKINASMDWYSWVAKKAPTSSTSTSTTTTTLSIS